MTFVDTETGEIVDDELYAFTRAEALAEIIRLRAEVARLYKLAYISIPLPKFLRRSKRGGPPANL